MIYRQEAILEIGRKKGKLIKKSITKLICPFPITFLQGVLIKNKVINKKVFSLLRLNFFEKKIGKKRERKTLIIIIKNLAKFHDNKVKG